MGTREWAENECNQNKKCTHLNDWGCDDKNWRYCVNVDIEEYKDPTSKHCSLLKTSTGSNGKSIILRKMS